MSFCHTTTRISHTYTYVPSLLDILPISLHITPFRVSQSPSLSSLSHTENFHWLSVYIWYCKFLLLFPYISPSPSSPPTMSHTSVIYVCFSIAALKINGTMVSSLQFPNVCVSIWYIYFSLWLISLCIMGSSFIHLIRRDSNAFLFMTE